MKKRMRADTFFKMVEEAYSDTKNRSSKVYVRKDLWVKDTLVGIGITQDTGRGAVILINSSTIDPETMDLETLYNKIEKIKENKYLFNYSPVIIDWDKEASNFCEDDGAFYIES